MLYSILSDTPVGDTANDAAAGNPGGMEWMSWVLIGLLVVAIIAMFVISSRRNKKRQKEAEDLINAVKPGNKVKTIGGVCGIVVEVDEAENTFVLETGSETSGKCYMKFDRQAIYQTDAVVEHESKDKNDEQPAEEEASSQEVVSDGREELPADAATGDAAADAKQK